MEYCRGQIIQAHISMLYGSQNSEQPGKAQFAPATQMVGGLAFWQWYNLMLS